MGTNEKPGRWVGQRVRPWQGRLVAVLLIVAGVVHAFKPAWLTLDWPSIVVILVGVLLLFIPLEDLGAVIESLEFGKTKILFRDTEKLRKETAAAVKSVLTAPSSAGPTSDKKTGVFVGRHRTHDSADVINEILNGQQDTNKGLGTIESFSGASEPEKDYANPKPAPFIDFDQISALLTADKEMALIRIAITIEEVLHELLDQEGLGLPNKKAEVFGRSIAELANKEVITPQIYHALVHFRDVRNKIVHWGKGLVPESAVTSTIASGLELLQALLVKINPVDSRPSEQ